MTATATRPAALPKRLPLQHRFETLEVRPHMVRAEDGTEKPEQDAYDIVLSSDTPVSRFGYLEILGHNEGEVDLSFASRGISFMLEHGGPMRSYSPDPRYHLGIITDLEVKGGKLRGVARFATDEALSEDGLRVKRDWASGSPTRPYLSVGWAPVARTITEPTKEAEPTVVRYTKWQPREGSNVAIPADPVAGKERSEGLEEFEVEDVTPAITQHRSQEETPMNGPTTTTPPASAAAPAPAAPGVEVGRDQAKARNDETAAIVQLCMARGAGERASEFISRGMTLDQVKTTLFDELVAEGRAQQLRTPSSEAIDGMNRKERRAYSFRRAALMGMQGRGQVQRDGLEFEVHKALEKQLPPAWQSRGGILVPFDLRSESEILDAHERKLEGRSMDSKTAGKGLEWVGQQTMQLVELLEAQTVLNRLGANFNTGLTGALTYPRETGAPTVTFLGENPAAGASVTDAATGEITSGPKQMIGVTKMSRQWLHMTGGLGEARMRFRLGTGHALCLDRNGLHGSGAANQPTGLYNLPGIQSVDMSNVTPTWPKLTEMGGKISDQNADLGRMGWVTTALLAWRLKATLMASAAGSQFIWTGPASEGDIGGYRAIGTTQASKTLGAGSDEHALGFGNWEYCDINLWGALELVLDELTDGASAMVRLNSYSMGDVVFTQIGAFCVADNAKPL